MELDQWLQWAPTLDAIYREELSRSAFSDPEAFVNWTYHWREHGLTPDAVRALIQRSPEWLALHPGPSPPATSIAQIVIPGPFAPRMYSYWPNAYVRGRDVIVFAGHADGRPHFYRIDRRDAVTDLGPLVPYAGESEGWYWTRDGWVALVSGARLLRVHPWTGAQQTLLDIASDRPGHDLWQAHSSTDGAVHSATVRRIVPDGAYPAVETVWATSARREYIPAHGTLDESQVTADGTHLHIKETIDGVLTNTFLALATGQSRQVSLAEGAVGHSDVGAAFVVGEWANPDRGQAVYWDLRAFTRRELYPTWNMGHVSVMGARCLLSDATALSWIDLATGARTEILQHGMVGTAYDDQVKANLDHTGTVAVYMTNHGVAGGPQDVVVVRLGG